MAKRSVVFSLMAMLMVLTYVMPSGFHLSHCHDQDKHLQVTATDCPDLNLFSDHKEQKIFSQALNHCCAEFTLCTSEINCRPAPLRSKQTVVSAPLLVSAPQSAATFQVSAGKIFNHIFHQPPIPAGNISVLRTIILQV